MAIIKQNRTGKERLKLWWMECSGGILLVLVYGGLYAIMESEGWLFWLPLLAMILIYGSAPLVVLANVAMLVINLWALLKRVVHFVVKITRLEKLLNKIGIERV